MREEKKKTTKERPQGAMLLHSSSSVRRSTAAVGCMSGIFRLFSNHHSNRRLTNAGSLYDSLLASDPLSVSTDFVAGKKEEQSGSVEIEAERRIIPTVSAAATEKRVFLLGALAKCDEDLRELKKIIEELKSDSLAVDRDNDDVVAEPIELSSGEQPSPVSVLDEVTRSPPFRHRGRVQYGNVQQQQQLKKIHKEEFLGSLHLISIQQAAQHGNNVHGLSLLCSGAMVETVEKACSEITWGEKRERERIGMALQDQIYRDLIHETVKEVVEMGNMQCAQHLKLSYINGKFHLHGCRRRLSY